MLNDIKALLLLHGVTGEAAAKCLAQYEHDQAVSTDLTPMPDIQLTPLGQVVPRDLFHGDHIRV